MSTTIASLRSALQHLQTRHEQGELDAEALAAAKAPLERELVALVMAAGSDAPGAVTIAAEAPVTAPAAPPRPSRRLWTGVSVAVLVLAVTGYALTGSPGAAGIGKAPQIAAAEIAASASADGQPAVTAEQVNEMVEKLAARLKDKPDDAVGWTMLARAYAALGRFPDALPAFQKALAIAGDEPNLLADYADTLAAANNGQLVGEPIKLVERALALDPNNLKALAMAGSAAFDARDYAGAVRRWEQVERGLPADSQFQVQVRASIAEARKLGGLPPAAEPAAASASLPATVAALPAAAGSAAAAPRSSTLSGSVSLAPALAAQAKPEDTVFVIARAANGPRMPLAVLRKQVKDLPLRFTLDDSMAMAPTAKISDHPQVIVIARISKSGNATVQAGDLSGQSAPVTPGTGGIVVEIREVAGP